MHSLQHETLNELFISVTDGHENDITTERTKQIEATSSEPITTATKIRDAVIEHILYTAPATDKPLATSSPPTTVAKELDAQSPETSSPTASTVKSVSTLAPTTEKSFTRPTTAAHVKRTEVTTPAPKPPVDEDYSFESMFSFLFNGDSPEPPPSPSSAPSSAGNTESETRIEHRADDETDERDHSVDVKQHAPNRFPVVDKHRHSEANEPAESKSSAETEQQRVDGKPNNPETERRADHVKPDVAPSGTRQQAEVKTRFDVRENVEAPPRRYDQAKPSYRDPSEHHSETEVNSHFDVRAEQKFQPADGETAHGADHEHQAPVGVHFYAGQQQPEVVGPHSDYRLQQTGVKAHTSGVRSPQPEVESTAAGKTPLKTKVDTEFNSLASVLKISGCNIYGRMYRVGKIISELSNPCLECMCTEIGVHCNQLKC